MQIRAAILQQLIDRLNAYCVTSANARQPLIGRLKVDLLLLLVVKKISLIQS